MCNQLLFTVINTVPFPVPITVVPKRKLTNAPTVLLSAENKEHKHRDSLIREHSRSPVLQYSYTHMCAKGRRFCVRCGRFRYARRRAAGTISSRTRAAPRQSTGSWCRWRTPSQCTRRVSRTDSVSPRFSAGCRPACEEHSIAPDACCCPSTRSSHCSRDARKASRRNSGDAAAIGVLEVRLEY